MGWTDNTTINAPGAVVDPASIMMNSGRQVDFTNTPDSYKGADGNKLIPAFTVVSQLASGKVIPRVGNELTVTVAVASNVATATKTAHGLAAGQQVYISGANLSYVNGIKTIATVPTADTFTFAATGSDATATGTIKAGIVACGMLVSNAVENSKSDSVSGYGIIVGGNLYENLLPDATGTPAVLSDEIKTELANAGTGFYFEQYGDSRTS